MACSDVVESVVESDTFFSLMLVISVIEKSNTFSISVDMESIGLASEAFGYGSVAYDLAYCDVLALWPGMRCHTGLFSVVEWE